MSKPIGTRRFRLLRCIACNMAIPGRKAYNKHLLECPKRMGKSSGKDSK